MPEPKLCLLTILHYWAKNLAIILLSFNCLKTTTHNLLDADVTDSNQEISERVSRIQNHGTLPAVV